MEKKSNINTKRFKADIRNWQRRQVRAMAGVIRNETKHKVLRTANRKKLENTIRPRLQTYFGIPERVIFSYAAHGYYLQVGSSRGHNKNKNPRKKVEWTKKLWESGVQELADIVVKHLADASVRSSAFKEKTIFVGDKNSNPKQ